MTKHLPRWALWALAACLSAAWGGRGVSLAAGENAPAAPTPAVVLPLDANANQILIAYQGALGATTVTRTREEAFKLAQHLAQELAADPSRFAADVEKYSDGSKAQGGAVGSFRRGRMTPIFEAAVFSLPIGGITAQPVESPYGFHLIQRVAVPAVYFGRCLVIAHDNVAQPAPPHKPRSEPEAAAAAAALYTELQAHPERFRELQMRDSDDPAKVLGGYLPDFYPGRADPALVQAVSAVKVGEVTAPIQTRHGYVLVERLEPLRNRPALKGFASANHLVIAYAGAVNSSATRSWLEARDLARSLAAQARKDPARFADLVDRFSDAPDRPAGGDLGFVDLEHLPPPLYEWGLALQQLPSGEVSDPVEASDGFHLLKRKDLPLRLRARQILVAWKGTPSKVVRDKAAAALQAAKYLADLKKVPPADLEKAFTQAVVKYSDDGGDQGGDLGTFKPQDYFPAITEALLKTPIGALSELVETPYGYAILLRLEPREKLPEELNPVHLPDPPATGSEHADPHHLPRSGGPRPDRK